MYLAQIAGSSPLFQGLSKNELEEIVGKAHFEFFKVEEGHFVVKEGKPVTRLVILLKGSMEVTTTTADRQLRTIETVQSPHTIEPDRLFGLHQYYLSDYRALEECQFLAISKQEVVALLDRYSIFRINLLNILANNLQRRFLLDWQAPRTGELEDRLLQLLLLHSRFPNGEKLFWVKMTTLANWLGCSRLAVSKTLRKLQEEGKVLLSRNMITVNG